MKKWLHLLTYPRVEWLKCISLHWWNVPGWKVRWIVWDHLVQSPVWAVATKPWAHIPLYWLVNRDPYKCLTNIPPLYDPSNRGFDPNHWSIDFLGHPSIGDFSYRWRLHFYTCKEAFFLAKTKKNMFVIELNNEEKNDPFIPVWREIHIPL